MRFGDNTKATSGADYTASDRARRMIELHAPRTSTNRTSLNRYICCVLQRNRTTCEFTVDNAYA